MDFTLFLIIFIKFLIYLYFEFFLSISLYIIFHILYNNINFSYLIFDLYLIDLKLICFYNLIHLKKII